MKRSPLKRVSTKRAAQLREYSKLRKQFLEEHPYCQWWLAERGLKESDVCPISGNELVAGIVKARCICELGVPRSTEVHHRNKRRGNMLNDTSHWMAVSREGHEWIESHKSEARAKGYLENF